MHDIQHMPATVATIVSLRECIQDFWDAAAVLDSAIQWWRNAMTEEDKLVVDKAKFYEKRLRGLSGLKGINVESLKKMSGAKHVEVEHVPNLDVFEETMKMTVKKSKQKPRYRSSKFRAFTGSSEMLPERDQAICPRGRI